MPRLLVCQHVPYEILGTLNPLLKSSGFRIRYVNFGRHPDAQPSLEGYQGLVVLGGPMSVNDTAEHRHLKTEMRLIEQAMEKDLPILGICLGAQLIAKTLGSEVYASDEKEIGWYDIATTKHAESDPLVGHFEAREKIFQWHGDTFDLPRGATWLAETAVTPHQAFSTNNGRVLALQFHVEQHTRGMERWLVGHTLELTTAGVDVNQLRADTQRLGPGMEKASRTMFDLWLDHVGVAGARATAPAT